MQATRRVLNYRLCFRISKHRTLHQIMILKLDAFAKAHKLVLHNYAFLDDALMSKNNVRQVLVSMVTMGHF